MWGVSRQFIDAGSIGVTESLEKPRLRLKLDNSLTLPGKLILGLNYSYTSGSEQDLWKSEASSSLSMSLYRSFLNNRLTVRLNAYDLLKRQWDTGTYHGRNVIFFRDNYNDSRCVTFCVRYTFNATKSKYRGTGAGNDEKNRL